MRQRKSAFFSGILVLGLGMASASVFAQQRGDSIASTQPIATVPFVLFHNRVYLPVEANGHKTFEMVVDTGAAISGLSEESASAIQLPTSGKSKVTGNGESHPKIVLAKNVTFRVGAAELLEKSVGVMSWEDLEAHEGKRIPGFLGVNLFRRYVVVIDYPGKTLTLYDPRDFVYRGSGERIPLRLGGAALFHAVIELPGHEPMPCDLAIDSGTYSALRLNRPYVEKHHLLEPQVSGIDSFGFGLGGEFPERLGRVSLLRIGSLELKEPVTSFSSAQRGATSTGSYDGTIGGALLSRFRVILDYPHKEMILEPASDFSQPWAADTSGVILREGGTNFTTIMVLHVLRDTPAAVAGIKEGDILISVDHQAASGLGLEGIRRLFTNPGEHRLELHREQQAVEIDMTTTMPLY